MKLTKETLKQIIKEELNKVLNEVDTSFVQTPELAEIGTQAQEIISLAFKNSGLPAGRLTVVNDGPRTVIALDFSGGNPLEPIAILDGGKYSIAPGNPGTPHKKINEKIQKMKEAIISATS